MRAEYERRQAVWQAIVESGPAVVQHVCNWALAENHATEQQLRLWFHSRQGVRVRIQSHAIDLDLNGGVKAVKTGLPQGLGFPSDMAPAHDPYDGLPSLSNTAPQEFAKAAIDELVKSLSEALHTMTG